MLLLWLSSKIILPKTLQSIYSYSRQTRFSFQPIWEEGSHTGRNPKLKGYHVEMKSRVIIIQCYTKESWEATMNYSGVSCISFVKQDCVWTAAACTTQDWHLWYPTCRLYRYAPQFPINARIMNPRLYNRTPTPHHRGAAQGSSTSLSFKGAVSH